MPAISRLTGYYGDDAPYGMIKSATRYSDTIEVATWLQTEQAFLTTFFT